MPALIIISIIYPKLTFEKEELENKKHNKEFYDNNQPECLSKSHAPETIIVKKPDSF